MSTDGTDPTEAAERAKKLAKLGDQITSQLNPEEFIKLS